jgi:probable phosphoglycerate mutase
MEQSLYLVRHGATEANLANRFAGRSAEPLLPNGVKQIHEVGTRLKGCNIVRIYSSPLPRAVQSAEILQSELAVPVVYDDALTDINIPHWDNLTKEKILSSFGDEYPIWLNQPDRFKLEGCETLAAVQARAVEAVKRYLANEAEGGNLLLVSHLIVLRCLVLAFGNLPLSEFRSVKIDSASVIRLTNHSGEQWSVQL